MARPKLTHRAPPLPPKAACKLGENKAERLLDILRGVALTHQRAEPQVFYPIRDVARHFRAPLSTVARIYNQLEDEGILVGIRGSKTLLQGTSSGRHLSVLGFVGMPAHTPLFVTQQDYRTFFIRMRRELRARGFAVATVFYDREEGRHGRLASRLDKYDFDTVLWHQPDRAAKETVPQLADSGVQTIGISDRGFPSIRCRYEVQREPAIMSILRDWHLNAGIKSVIVARGVQTSAQKEELLKTLLEEEDLSYEFQSAGDHRPSDFLDSLARDGERGIIFPSLAAAFFAFRAPHALAQLMMRARVALSGGPVNIPFAQAPEVAVDLVVVDWQLVAEQIVSDLISRKAFDRAKTTVFEAKAHLRTPLSLYAQSL
jgi:hypothetical protein